MKISYQHTIIMNYNFVIGIDTLTGLLQFTLRDPWASPRIQT